jgi:hypothetical protein
MLTVLSMVRLGTNVEKSRNPLDAKMTKAQVVRRRFKSSLPRRIENRVLSPMEAMARTMALFDQLRSEMEAAGLKKSDVEAGLVFCQPETKGEERVLARTARLPKPEDIGTFVEKVMALHKPLFLGVMFLQVDREAEKEDQKNVGFLCPLMAGPEAEGRMIAALKQQAQGGFAKVAN